MAYTKTVWNDRIKDSQGNIVQEGTPVSAGNLNKIEKGIEDAHKQMEQAAKETVSLPYGLSVLNSPNGSPLDVQIEGRTLVSMANSDFEGGKKYVLADPKTAVVIDGTTYKGVSKFEGKNARPIIIRTANFEGKVPGSVVECPHTSKVSVTSATTILSPNNFSIELFATGNQGYDRITKLDNSSLGYQTLFNGGISQQLLSFNLIEEVERKVGKIPGSMVSDKVAWLKNNLNKLTCNWYGYGSSVGGNKANVSWWNVSTNVWSSPLTYTNAAVGKFVRDTKVGEAIDTNGLVHFLAYAEASDGVTASIINTDYVDLDIELKSTADFYAPRVPLYEVPQESYDKILVEWDAAAVATRYPMVEGIKSLQNPYVMAEGENLLSPFTDVRYMHPNAKATAAYEAVLDATDKNQHIYWVLDVIPGQQYTFSYEANGEQQSTSVYEWVGSQGAVITNAAKTNPKTFTIPSNCKQIVVFMSSYGVGSITYKNPMLTLGSVAKPFKPRNPSYLYAETILRELNSVTDSLYQIDGNWKLLKKWEELLFAGDLTWESTVDFNGFKRFRCVSLSNAIYGTQALLDYKGSIIPGSDVNASPKKQTFNSTGFYITVSDSDTGFVDSYIPTTDEIKAYFNGWKVKAVDGSNKPTAWVSAIDGKDAPTQTLDYVKVNKAPDYTGYRLLYQLATPKVVDITDKVEGSLSVSGQTQVSLDSGVVVREKATPVLYPTNSRYYINATNISSKLKNRAGKLINVYKNGRVDNSWIMNELHISTNQPTYGLYQANTGEYDSTAEYYVTYLVLDKEIFTNNPVNVKASYNTSIRSTVDQMNEQLADVKSMASIHDRYLYKLLLAAKANGWSV